MIDQGKKRAGRSKIQGMRSILIAWIVCFGLTGNSQQKPSLAEISLTPVWAQKMYSDSPNLYEVDSLYDSYYRFNTFVKSYHTQYYKRWRRSVLTYVDEQGVIVYPTSEEFRNRLDAHQAKQSIAESSNWTPVGPMVVHGREGTQAHTQANVYCIAQSLSDSSILYCGTEPGEVYKSSDGGNTWVCVSMGQYFGSGGSQIWGIGVSAVAIHPLNPDIVFAGGDGGIFRSVDGGQSWINVLPQTSFGVHELLVHPTIGQLVFAATDKGFYRSIDGGNNWSQLFPQKTYDVKCNTVNSAEMYLVKNNPTLVICEFYRSVDYGSTWSLQSAGWYSSTHPDRSDMGARIAVTPANPGRVYAYLIGEAKTNDYGFIGVFRSDDGWQNWTLPNGPTGGPYTATHPNLAYGVPSWTYHQGFYNCALMVSATNADHLLIGGLNLWRSNDGGYSFSSVAGYSGGPLDMHVDMQDFRTAHGNYWITTDGGIYRSTDFFNSAPDFKMHGLRGSDYWGFGSGWNEDVLVGGLYHNGNLAHHEIYGAGNFLSLGGGEDATGYVNPGNNRRTYFSDIGGVILPWSITDPLSHFTVGKFPNQSYYAAESSEMEFHPNCYNIAIIGNENKLWKTSDGGASYVLMHTFGTSSLNQVKYIEISSSNPEVIYVTQQPNSGNTGTLWKTTNGGSTWSTVPLPPGNSRRMLITLNPMNEDELWIAFPGGSNGNKIFKSNNGGLNWSNLTSPLLNNESVQSIVHIAGTNGGIYYCTDFAVYYRNTSMTDWVIVNAGLPTYCNTNIARPFYRDGKIRIATYGKGIWESELYESPVVPLARISADKLEMNVLCVADSFRFEDYSFLNHQNASWFWEFENGFPANSGLRNPVVLFPNAGTHKVRLTITDGNAQQSVDSIFVSISFFSPPASVTEDFEQGLLPLGWAVYDEDQGGQWQITNLAGGFGQSSNCVWFNNYDIDSKGSSDDLRVLFSTQNAVSSTLTFDVAYTYYATNYSDTLEVLASLDCGQTFHLLYKKGGANLATAPSSSNSFIPGASQWRTDTVSLAAFLNQPEVLIAFRNRGFWGNNLFLDNIRIKDTTISIDAPYSRVDCRIYPNPASPGKALFIEFPSTNGVEIGTVRIRDMQGREVFSTLVFSGQSFILPANGFAPGYYMVNVATEQQIWNSLLMINP